METLLNGVGRYFPEEHGWTVVPISSDKIDLRDTQQQTPIRCIDYRYGIMPNGSYDPVFVPKSPAWLGALDGVSAFLEGDAEERHQEAAERVRSTGFTPADHGDIALGEIDGCAFRRALQAKHFPDLSDLTPEETRVLRSKIGVKHITLNTTDRHPEGFLLNPHRFMTALPDNARFYPIDIWYPVELGIEPDRLLPVVEKCGQLLLPSESRVLYIVLE